MLHSLRVIGWIEGSSLLLLFFIAMPMKYLAQDPSWVRVVGMAHGLLFLAFLYLLTMVGRSRGWSWKRIFLGYLSSSVPFGTFWYDRKYLVPAEQVS